MTLSTILFYIVLAYGPSLLAVRHTPEKYILCKNKSIVRTIRIEKKVESNQCETRYTKAGIDRIIGRGLSIKSCDKILLNVQGNLEEAHWRCRDITKSNISKLGEKSL